MANSSRSNTTKSRGTTKVSARSAAPRVSSTRRFRISLSKEAWSVVVLVGSLLVGIGAYSHVLGPLGSFFHGFLAVLFGHSGWVVVVGAAIVSVGVLANFKYAASKMSVVDVAVVQFMVASVYGVVHETNHGGRFSFVGVVHYGGVVGELFGYLFLHLAGKIGGFVLIGLLLLLALANLGGLHLERVSAWVSSQLRESKAPTGKGPFVQDEPSDRERVKVLKRSKIPKSPVGPQDEALEFQDIPIFAPNLENEIAAKDTSPPIQSKDAKDQDEPLEIVDLAVFEDRESGELRLKKGTSGSWKLPAKSILSRGSKQRLNKAELIERGNALQSSLGTFGVGVKVVGMTVGPTVTRYELELAEGVKVNRLLSLHRDIAYAMAATDVRILAPIPGRSAVGVEVPNRTRETVTLGDVMASSEMSRAKHPLQVPVGKDISGSTVVANLAEMPHVLIAGSTGSGKSSALNSILTSILMRSTPDEVRLILIDPKRVELGQYSRLPHLLTSVVVDPKKAANALAWAVKEMESRYDLLAAVGVRDITGYNALIREANSEGVDRKSLSQEIFGDSDHEEAIVPLPFILVVVDELNDLMMVAARDVEDSICRIAQKARAVGIHLIIATQRPSVDVITGVIKANVPSRIAFSVASLADSRVVLDQSGAEKLVGKGDLLMITASSSHPKRVQAPWVSEAEVRQVVSHWSRLGGPSYIEGVEGEANTRESFLGSSSQDDDLYREAVKLVVGSQLGSTSMLQRKLKVGFARAGRIMDLLEQGGIVGPPEGSKPRVVLVTPEQLEDLNS